MNLKDIKDDYKNCLSGNELICSDKQLSEFLSYGIVIQVSDDKYVGLNNQQISITRIRAKTLNLDFNKIIQQAEIEAKKNYCKRVYYMNEEIYSQYKTLGRIILKNSIEYYRLYSNEEWLVVRY